MRQVKGKPLIPLGLGAYEPNYERGESLPQREQRKRHFVREMFRFGGTYARPRAGFSSYVGYPWTKLTSPEQKTATRASVLQRVLSLLVHQREVGIHVELPGGRARRHRSHLAENRFVEPCAIMFAGDRPGDAGVSIWISTI